MLDSIRQNFFVSREIDKKTSKLCLKFVYNFSFDFRKVFDEEFEDCLHYTVLNKRIQENLISFRRKKLES